MKEDEELLARIQHFEERALVEAYDRYSPGIYRYARRLLGDEYMAEDCVSETFSRFLMALKGGNGPRRNLSAYLYRVAHNWITDCYRRKPPQDSVLEESVQADSHHDPHQRVLLALEEQGVRKALFSLTPDQRQVIVLKYVEEWDNLQIAAALQKPVGAVKSLQHRAITRLRRLLGGSE